VAIPCPGQKLLTSTQTATCDGIFTESNSACAKSEAETAVQNDLVAKANGEECENGCLKEQGVIQFKPATVVSCHRVWWTLFIMVECEATATGELLLKCSVQG
jgi:hypothetical protein